MRESIDSRRPRAPERRTRQSPAPLSSFPRMRESIPLAESPKLELEPRAGSGPTGSRARGLHRSCPTPLPTPGIVFENAERRSSLNSEAPPMISSTASATTVPRPTDAPSPIVSPRPKTGAPAPAAAPQPADASSPAAAPRQTRAPSPAASPRPAGAPAPPPPRLPASERSPELPGCRPFHLPASELETWESRIEVWDGRTETAWVCEPATGYHEQPTRRLAKITEADSPGARLADRVVRLDGLAGA